MTIAPTPPVATGYPDLSPDATRLAGRLRPGAPPERPLKVFFWPADPQDGCFLLRCQAPAEELVRLGHEVQMSQSMGDWAREEADIVVGQRVAPQRPSIGWQVLCAAARKAGRPRTVYEVDDDLFNIDPKTNPLAEIFHVPAIRQNMIDNIRASSAVTVSTEPLAAILRQWNRNVHVIPNAVRREVFDVPPTARRDGGRVIFGWQGSGTHADDLLVAEDALRELLTTDGAAHLRFLGSPYWHRLHAAGVPSDRMDAFGWTTDIGTHYKRVARFDVSLAPLADTVFNRSKSGLRVQESLALGVPVVASDVPAYRGWVEHGVTGLLVNGRDEWLAALRLLSASPTVRRTMGEEGRRRSAAWTIEASIHRWVDVYRSLL